MFLSDIGMLRHRQGEWGSPTGELVATFVIAEIHKWVRTADEEVQLYSHRTRAGLEVNLMVQPPPGRTGFDIKARCEMAAKDLRSLRELAAALKSGWRGGIAGSRGTQIAILDSANRIWSVPPHRWLAF